MNIPVCPIAVLGYAVKHNYPELMRPAAYRAYVERCDNAAVIEALGPASYGGRWVSCTPTGFR